MGAWGHLNFENDTALDFVWDLEEKGTERIKNAIEAINAREEDSFLDSDLCAEALAAIEFIAATKGRIAEDFPEDAREWLKANEAGIPVNNYWITKSKQAIDRIQHNSELKDLWEETEDHEAWTKVLEDLNTRIS
jgi:hypothetical protein